MNEANYEVHGRGIPWRAACWSAAAILLLVPLVAMQFTREVNWTVGDFIFAGLMFAAVGAAFELTVRLSTNHSYRAGVAAALAGAFLTIWINGAVGMVGDEGNSYNLVFLGVVAIALLGSILARFRAEGMARAMMVAAIAQFIAGAFGLLSDVRGGILSAIFAGVWLLSAVMFERAARQQGQAGTAA